ncbi:hypothetical protein XU18_3886 [Perkinsela sp. CCAP 1560/4]|nr:hypothetical protein XU18_3886 [Perkinsela sp. CCAP 1560/4]|eukprot:KNH05012.1 hypothetical protein XU18_3886 [Perkinsela sp. CCAP 1560/4]
MIDYWNDILTSTRGDELTPYGNSYSTGSTDTEKDIESEKSIVGLVTNPRTSVHSNKKSSKSDSLICSEVAQTNFVLAQEYCQKLPSVNRKRRVYENSLAEPSQSVRKYNNAGTQTMTQVRKCRNLSSTESAFLPCKKTMPVSYFRPAYISKAGSGDILLEFCWQAVLGHGMVSSEASPKATHQFLNLDFLDTKERGLLNGQVILFLKGDAFHLLSYGGQPVFLVECTEDPIVNNKPYKYARSVIVGQGESAILWPTTKLIISAISLVFHYQH